MPCVVRTLEIEKGRKKEKSLITCPCVGVSSKHQRVNLCYYASGSDGVLKDTRFMLVQAECPYVQFVAAARVISTEKFIVGVTNRRERDMSQVSNGKIKWVPRARSLLSYVFEVRC